MTIWKRILQTSDGDEYRSSASVGREIYDLDHALKTTYRGGEFSHRAFDDYVIRQSDYEY